ncbi:MAG TPA: alpha/beta hydrolase [Ferruginibacter sp.]|nr:alpha/beta hydrolase [Ferruginibacter sp.]
MKKYRLLFLLIAFHNITFAQVTYPYPVKYFPLSIENKEVQMAYMDIAAQTPGGMTVFLFHGKNFNGYYWKDVVAELSRKGYRVIVPDQVGWGRSDKPDIHYSFHLLAANSRVLLDSLNIKKVIVIGHSMGGMLAARFALMYPAMVEKMVLENPIGLEDYKTFVPYQSLEKIFDNERKATYESYKKYQQSYYPLWKPEYEQYVKAQAEPLTQPDFEKTAWANALTYQMIYEQPVVYELKKIQVPTLLIIGYEDRTVVGKNLLTEADKKKYGQYPKLGRKINAEIRNSKLVELRGVGHIPHIQSPAVFTNALFGFL